MTVFNKDSVRDLSFREQQRNLADYIHTHTHIYMYIYIYIYTHTHTHIYIHYFIQNIELFIEVDVS
jgi:hypothetical protein